MGDIDEKKLIDNHYYAIASKATLLSPQELPVPPEAFKKKFGVEWASVLRDGLAANAMQACKAFDINEAELDAEWKKAQDADDIVKLGGGFYCGKVTARSKTLYVFNAFFMTMRAKFTAPGASIYYYSVMWDPSSLSWADFRGKVLGPTDPRDGPLGAIRRTLHDDWEGLGLKSVPDKGDNGVHASASPFEGLAERMNWLQVPLELDPFGSALLAQGLTVPRIQAWSVDPQVSLGGGKSGSVFDALEDLDVQRCLAKLEELDSANPA
eukprot:NODE_2355_length_951_cov_283.962054.p1 GENE.NODE_2355_length_951_cov_283.962054~~NODE_2355_length_951_cov_283.962054.p1  ORF type:complete len:267 (+),score=99.93 NODE_2355_length_951_cov_283.962054:3-803(+)